MPIIQPDTSQAVDFSTIMEPGTYSATVSAVAAEVSKKGNPMLVVSLDVDYPAAKKPLTRKSYMVFSGEGAYNFESLLRATGFDREADMYSDPSSPNPAFDTDSLINQELNVVVENRMFEGSKRDEIRGFLPR